MTYWLRRPFDRDHELVIRARESGAARRFHRQTTQRARLALIDLGVVLDHDPGDEDRS